MQTYLNMNSIIGGSGLVDFFKTCQNYLKTYHDLPIEEKSGICWKLSFISVNIWTATVRASETDYPKLWEKLKNKIHGMKVI